MRNTSPATSVGCGYSFYLYSASLSTDRTSREQVPAPPSHAEVLTSSSQMPGRHSHCPLDSPCIAADKDQLPRAHPDSEPKASLPLTKEEVAYDIPPDASDAISSDVTFRAQAQYSQELKILLHPRVCKPRVTVRVGSTLSVGGTPRVTHFWVGVTPSF